MRTITVTAEYDNAELTDFVMKSFSEMPYSVLRKAFRNKDVRLNGIRLSSDVRVRRGDTLSLYISDKDLFGEQIFDIIYENDEFAVINKYSGILTCDSDKNEFDLTKLLNEQGKYLPCHRIDRNTAGLILFARDDKSLEYYTELIKAHKLYKRYICILSAMPPKRSDRLVSYIRKTADKGVSDVFASNVPGSKISVTSYKVIGEYHSLPVVSVEIETGRTHQIRAQMSAIGCPVLGDGKYGNNSINKSYGVRRQILISSVLAFDSKYYSLTNEQILKHIARAGIKDIQNININGVLDEQ